jgi:hypothetical protein
LKDVVLILLFVRDSMIVRIEPLYVMERNAMTMEKNSRNTLIRNRRLIGKENEGKGSFFKEIVKNDGTKAQP